MTPIGTNKLLLARAMTGLLILLLAALLTPNLETPDHTQFPVEELAYAQLPANIEQALKLPEEAWSAANLGYYKSLLHGTHQIWRRVRIPPTSTGKPERLIAEADLLFLAEVDLHLAEGDRVLTSLETGMDRPIAIKSGHGSRHFLEFEQHPTRSRVIYARIAADFLYLAPFVVRTESRSQHIRWLREMAAGGFLGAMIGLILYTFALSVHLQRDIYRIYGIFLASSLVLCIVLNGSMLELLGLDQIRFGQWIKTMIAACFLTIAAYLSFSRVFLRMEKNFPSLDRYGNILTKAALAAMPLTFLLPTSWSAITLVLAVIMLSIITISVCLPKLTKREVAIYFYAASAIIFGAILQAALAPITLPTILNADGLFLLGSLIGAQSLSIAIARQVSDTNEQHMKMDAALANETPMTAINAYLDNSFADQFEAAEMAVSIMFVDMASFSRMAELVDSKTLLVEMSRQLEKITRIVQEHGGTIDRSLGDGVLAFFGYNRSSTHGGHHAKQAFEAANEIQLSYFEDMQRSFERREALIPLPVRIGIHTDKVTIGNMGTTSQIDFTMVGNGVNFANRLETACSPYRIMLSTATRDALVAKGVDAQKFERVLIAVKHQIELVPAFESNPHGEHIDQLMKLNGHFLLQMGEHVKSPRVSMKDSTKVMMSSIYGTFQLRDFSPRGFLIAGNSYLAQKSSLTLSIDTQDEVTNLHLKSRGLNTIEVEVRWSRKIGTAFLHGVLAIGGHAAQWDFLHDTLLTINADGEEQVA